jgi:hypothetical protein
MKYLLRALVLGLACLASVSLTACGSGGDQFTNRLTFGTGIGGNGFDLVNEGTTFTATPDIWFKLESAEDMAGRAVRLYINGGTYGTKDYKPTQDYGHYFLSSFRITDVGTFTVKGNLVAQVGPDIGKETFIAEASLTMK